MADRFVYTCDVIEKAKELRAQGYSYRRIADALGGSLTTWPRKLDHTRYAYDIRCSKKDETRRRKSALHKARYEANKEKILARMKARYEANKKEITEYNKAYRETNKEKRAAQCKARREQLKKEKHET